MIVAKKQLVWSCRKQQESFNLVIFKTDNVTILTDVTIGQNGNLFQFMMFFSDDNSRDLNSIEAKICVLDAAGWTRRQFFL